MDENEWSDEDSVTSGETSRIEDAIGGTDQLDALLRFHPNDWLAFRLFDDGVLAGFLIRAPQGEQAIFELVLDGQEREVFHLRSVLAGEQYFAFTTKERFSTLVVRRASDLLSTLNRPHNSNPPFGMEAHSYQTFERELAIMDYAIV